MDGDTADRRLFVGTFLSAEQQELLGELKRQNDRLVDAWGKRLRWVKYVKLHMTWLFLGKTDESAVDAIGERLSGIVTDYAPMQVTYDRLEFWPSARKPRQLVMTPSVVPDQLSSLAGHIKAGLKDYTEKPEDRQFRPHLTLLRMQHEQTARASHAERRRLELPTWFDTKVFLPLVHDILSLALIESHLGKGGDDYEVLKSFQLKNR